MFSDSVRNFAAALVVAALLIATFILGKSILLPLAVAVVFTFILAPLVRALSKRRVPRGLAVGIVMIGAIALVGSAATGFSSQILSLTADLSRYQNNLVEKARSIADQGSSDNIFKRAARSIASLETSLKREFSDEGVTNPAPTSDDKVVVAVEDNGVTGLLMSSSVPMLEMLGQMALTLLFTAFLLADYHDIRDRVVRLAGTDNMTATTAALSDAGTRLSHFFLYQTAINVVFGVVVGLALSVIGVPYPVLWGGAAMVLQYIPFIGSLMAALPPIVLAAAVDPGWSMVLATAAVFIVAQFIMGNLVEPRVLGSRAGISPFAMITAASFWTLIWGPVGLLLSAPLSVSLVVLGQYVPGLDFLRVLLSNNPALSPDQEFYHRLLSADAAAAAEQIEDGAETMNPAELADAIVLPALRMAANDHRIGRLDDEQLDKLADTMNTVVDFIDGIEFGDDAHLVKGSDGTTDILVIPGSGPVDALAARFIAAVLSAEPNSPKVAAAKSSALTALGGLRAAGHDKLDARTLLITTVGGVDTKHLGFFARRARRDFPAIRVLVCDFANLAPVKFAHRSTEKEAETYIELARVAPQLANPHPPKPSGSAEQLAVDMFVEAVPVGT